MNKHPPRRCDVVNLPDYLARHRIRCMFAGLVLVTAMTGCGAKTAEKPAAKIPEVRVVTLRPESVALTTELPGRTSAFLTADVRPQVSGVLLKRTFTEGAEVAAGTQLYQIDPATYHATLDTAQATLRHNAAALITARAKEKRYKPLADAQAVSRQDYDDSLAASGEAAADIETAKASIEQARINLDYTKVLSPISGMIGRSSVTAGALVTANQTTALATVTTLDPIYVDVTQTATTLLRLKQELAQGKIKKSGPNQAQVRLLFEDGTQYPIPGTLQFSEVNVDQGTGTIVLRAVFRNPDKLLLPGLYVRAELQEGVNDAALLVPQEGVTHNTHGDPTALIVGSDGKVALKIIEASREVDNKWIVTAGLVPGDKVIVDGLQGAVVGAEVHATEAFAPAATKQ